MLNGNVGDLFGGCLIAATFIDTLLTPLHGFYSSEVVRDVTSFMYYNVSSKGKKLNLAQSV